MADPTTPGDPNAPDLGTQYGQLPVDPTTTTTSSSGGLPDWLTQMFPGGGGNLQSLSLIPALAGAAQNYANAGQYQTLAQQYAGQLDPFSQQRAQYQTQLSNLENDPNKVLSTDPTFQSLSQLGLGATNRAAMGKTGGATDADDIQFNNQLLAQYIPQKEQQLAQLAGANITPAAAAGILQTGMQGTINSQNTALGDMFLPWLMSSQNGQGATGAGTGANGSTTSPTGLAGLFSSLFGKSPSSSGTVSGNAPDTSNLNDTSTYDPNNTFNPQYPFSGPGGGDVLNNNIGQVTDTSGLTGTIPGAALDNNIGTIGGDSSNLNFDLGNLFQPGG